MVHDLGSDYESSSDEEIEEVEEEFLSQDEDQEVPQAPRNKAKNYYPFFREIASGLLKQRTVEETLSTFHQIETAPRKMDRDEYQKNSGIVGRGQAWRSVYE